MSIGAERRWTPYARVRPAVRARALPRVHPTTGTGRNGGGPAPAAGRVCATHDAASRTRASGQSILATLRVTRKRFPRVPLAALLTSRALHEAAGLLAYDGGTLLEKLHEIVVPLRPSIPKLTESKPASKRAQKRDQI